jgi:hypothetical protein
MMVMVEAPVQTNESLLAEVRVYQQRLVKGEQTLMADSGRRHTAKWQKHLATWTRLKGAYEWAVSDLRTRGLEEPPLEG